MAMLTIEQRLVNLIGEQLGIPRWDVTPEKNIVRDLHADSLDQIEIVMAVEEEFEIDISDEEAETALTVADALAIVRKHLNLLAEQSAKETT